MRLEEYWGVGPKTAERLEAELGVEESVAAIESANSQALVDAGIPRGRATRILRRANGEGAMGVLATDDARSVYKELVGIAEDFALTRHAADRIRVLTPLREQDAMAARLDRVLEAVETWRDLAGDTREDVLAAFEAHDSRAESDRSAVETALALRDVGVTTGAFAPLSDLDTDALADAADALGALDGGDVRAGADGKLDRLRERRDAVADLERDPAAVLEAVRSEGVRGTDEFREAFVQYVAAEADVAPARVREAAAADATDAADFVSATLRELAAALREDAAERETEVAADLEAAVGDARADVDAAVEAVRDLAFYCSLARFALAYDCTRPTYVAGEGTLAVAGARNLSLAAGDVDVQPITYAVGDHDLAGPPSGDRVAVLTGANSGGKTTLLETLCQVSVLAQMGLPVPAEAAAISVVDSIVFHRRHASFNAGVLESTLRSVVPPLSGDGRTLMLVDEFEAITEPGRAADLLHGLVSLTVDRAALGVYVTHLADDLEPLPEVARTDGIFAEGLDADLALEVDYQPRFGVVGRSTPEFIVSRLVADADDRAERAGYEELARAIGEEVVQRTLSEAYGDGG